LTSGSILAMTIARRACAIPRKRYASSGLELAGFVGYEFLMKEAPVLIKQLDDCQETTTYLEGYRLAYDFVMKSQYFLH
jgi:hypothetical protein